MKISLRCLATTLLLLLSAPPLLASHGRLTVTRSPSGPVLAGSQVLLTARIENTSETGIDLFDADVNTFFSDPHLQLIPGTVTTRYEEIDNPVGTIVSGNDPGDDDVVVQLDPVPPGWTAEIRFRAQLAGAVAADVEEAFTQVFLTYCDGGFGSCQSIPWFVIVPIVAEPALELNKTDFGASVVAGNAVSYNLVVTNVGTREATGLTLTDTVPPRTRFLPTRSHPDWSCAPNFQAGSVCTITFDSLWPGDLEAFGFTLQTDPPPVPAGLDSLRNVGRVEDDGSSSGTPEVALDFEDTPLLAQPDLSVSLSDGGATVASGGTVSYALTYRQRGTQDATGVFLQATVPAHARFASAASTPGWTCSPTSGAAGATCTLLVGDFPVGATDSTTFALRLDSSLPAGFDRVTQTVSIADDGANGADPTPADNQASETTPVEAAPDLTLAKGDGNVSATPGDTVAYSLSYRNVGDQAAQGVVLEETVPQHTSFVAAASSSGWTCSPGSGAAGATCTLALGDVAAGRSGSATFAVRLDEAFPAGVDRIVNTVTIRDDGANGADPTPANNQASATTPVEAAPDLTLAKGDGNVSATPGATVAYTLSYRNVGDQGARGVVLEETVPQHTSFVAAASSSDWTCSPGSGAAGATCTLALGDVAAGTSGSTVFAVRLDEAFPAGVDRIVNTVTIRDDGANGEDRTPGDNQASETTVLDAAPDLTLRKTDGGASVRPGELVSYSLISRNVGTQTATGVVIRETVPEHARFEAGASSDGWSCSPGVAAGSTCTLLLGNLPVDASDTATFAVRVDSRVPAGLEQVSNTARVGDDGANGEDLDPADNEDSESTPVEAAPDLQLEKTASPAVVRPGETLVYTLTYRNVGSQEASGVVLEEAVPEHTTFEAGASDPGWSCGAAVSVAAAHSEPLNAERIQESLKAERIQGKLAGLPTCRYPVGDLAAGESGSVTFAVVLAESQPAGVEEVSNAARLRDDGANGEDLDPADNEDSETTPVEAAPDLRLEKTASPDVVRPGETLVYTLAYRNVGSQGASGVVLDEAVPEHTTFDAGASDPGWTCDSLTTMAERLKAERIQSRLEAERFQENPRPWRGSAPLKAERIQQPLKAERIQSRLAGLPSCTLSVGELAPGDSGSVTFAVVLAESLPAGVEEVANAALLTDDGTNGDDLTPGDNGDAVTTPVEAAPDLALRKSASASSVRPGETLTYVLDVSNVGSQGAEGVVLEEIVPEHTRFAAGASDPGWSCGEASASVLRERLKAERIQNRLDGFPTCTYLVGALGPGESATVSFAVTLIQPVPAGVQEIVNLARVLDDGSNGDDLDPGDNEDSTTTPVEIPDDPDAPPDDPGGPPDDPDDPPGDPPALDLFLADLLAEDRDASGGASAGDVLAYSATVLAPAQEAALGAVLTVPVPEHTTYVPGSLRGVDGVPQLRDSVLRIPLGDLPSGARFGLAWDVRIDPELPEAVDEIVAQAAVEAQGLSRHLSDDPDTRAVDDPTVTLLEGPGDGPVDVPTAGEYALLVFALLLTVGAWRLLGWKPSYSS